MLLNDGDVRRELDGGELVVTNLAEGAIGPCSIDLMLSNDFVYFEQAHEIHKFGTPVDPKRDNSQDGWDIRVADDDFFRLGPGDFALATTREKFTFPAHLAGQLEGKSSLARLGLFVHVTAGFFDAGFEGYPTLELFNARRRPIKLYPGMPVAQMSIFRMSSRALLPYNKRGTSKYVNDSTKPGRSMYHRNFPEE